ncbi:hypothetical protein [Robiginitalea aurantiaca]|uniref:CHRD domain-containing protein n=1 Tax=Robiginitalea aurantiaca TaxID=3056915 RepID=A0ABT7WIR7_9FLAO|nr:hypothetical protein [Robiginitalea aurantiaca]MDM9632805.1 hypothetical protein [Robiginitalea aurantiaca]
MKKVLFPSIFVLLILIGCSETETIDVNNPNTSDPDSEIPTAVERVDYQLESFGASGVTGTAAFIPNEDGSTTIYIQLENASQGIHPATLNFGNKDGGGTIAVTLTECECAISETLVTQLDNGAAITFVELMGFDGHLNIYESPSDGTIIAQTNIGSNAF